MPEPVWKGKKPHPGTHIGDYAFRKERKKEKKKKKKAT